MAFSTGGVTQWRSYILHSLYVCAVSQKSVSVTPADTEQWRCLLKCDSLTQPLPSSERGWTATLPDRKVPSLHWRQHSNFDILNINEFSYHSIHPQYKAHVTNPESWTLLRSCQSHSRPRNLPLFTNPGRSQPRSLQPTIQHAVHLFNPVHNITTYLTSPYYPCLGNPG